VQITRVRATPLTATWEHIFGSSEAVPAGLRTPAANQVVFSRTGQFSTLVEVSTDEGLTGIGECYGLPDPVIVAAIVRRILAPQLVGHDALETEALWDRMMELPRGMGFTRGLLMQAIAGVDMALWDLKARAQQIPLARLLGGTTDRTVPTYASPVPHLDTTEESAEAAGRFVKDGFTAVKLKVGRGVRTDLAHVAAVREALGSEIALLLDCNCAYDVDEATELARQVEPYDIYWLEEPLQPEDVDGMRELRRSCGLRLAAGENEFTALGARALVQSGALDVLMPNLARTGVTGALLMANLAAANNVDIAPHGVGSAVNLAASLHFLAAIPNGSLYEYNRLPNPLRDALGDPTPQFEAGALSIPDGNGIGISLVPDIVAAFSDHDPDRQDPR
jgi:L-alanine-DL-glutamate epimerase-like enolase superfamily enzyme